MKCPHCLQNIHSSPETKYQAQDVDGFWQFQSETCPACSRLIFSISRSYRTGMSFTEVSSEYVHPHATQRPPPPPAVTEPYRGDYIEACAVFPYSPKASAALTRRTLQAVLREKGGFTKHDLADQIKDALDSNKLPTHISQSLDAVRNIGNFAAHAQKSKSSGELLDVEPGEAEWNLEVIEALFDYYFVQPEIVRAKKAALDKKLAAAGKPPLKG